MPYRPSAFRKQDHGDFSRRVKQIDPMGQVGGPRGRNRTQPKVVTAALLGFGAAYTAAAIGTNRATIEATLRQQGLTSDTQQLVLSALTAALAATLVMLTLQVIRTALTAGVGRKNGRAYVLGAALAFAMFYTPDAIYLLGYDLLDGHSQGFLAKAGDLVGDVFPGLDIDQIRFTSSRG
ncbi:hypothetical protein [Antarctobacter heliothermus]|uniref:Uncharacterized protein n=1 Tax=Antarctobacter heliothermus TaxID=74033 RepID=A0A239EE89_9RHOB|nr:hypothetical protein [Antarctobacter heliothermus]SNS42598.1 hypothetical protein SAMN04488078_101475 [Antarctobacter heliothermus]